MRRILLLSAYHTASHKSWCQGLIQQLNGFDWTLLCLPDRFFRWRIRGNPLSWYESPELAASYDLIIATSMVDLATLKGIHSHLAAIPCLLYFHENQFAYPLSSKQHDSIDPQMVNLYSAMAADCLVFNSKFNYQSFLQGVQQLLNNLPDQTPKNLLTKLEQKSQILSVPIADDCVAINKKPNSPIHLVWAARWEYDKGPERLLAALVLLEKSGLDYRLNLIGQQFRQIPAALQKIRELYAHRLLAYGYQASRAEYLKILQTSDVFISTAIHEFQGLAALEAVACGCLPLVPNRLSYPELFEPIYCYDSYPGSAQSDIDQEAQALVHRLQSFSLPGPSLTNAGQFHWSAL